MPLERTPTNSKLSACVTSPDLIGCNTHFYQGHTVPCSLPECEACTKGVPWAWHGYVGAMKGSTREHFLFEFTPQVADVLKDYRAHNGTLRGCIFIAQRHNNRPNGRVILQTRPGDLAALNLPPPPDLEACMAIIWNLERSKVREAPPTKGHNRMQVFPGDIEADRIIQEERTRRNGSGHP